MTEHPINLKSWEVRAILDGRKTMTRRVLKPQPVMRGTDDCVITYEKGGHTYSGPPDFLIKRILPEYGLRWRVGDRLWVREAHYLTDDGYKECVCYAADEEAVRSHIANIHLVQRNLCLTDRWAAPHLRKYSPAVMPRWASRITLLVTDVRVERVQDIREADAVAEGVNRPHRVCEDDGTSYTDGFAQLWGELHGPDAWERNDWVAVTKFERVT